jgi:hypothetical protein
MGLELEVGILKWLTGELVPVFVTGETPPMLGFTTFSGREESVRQESNGWGPLSGTSIGLGFWLGGEALRGYVLRAIFQNYAYTYRSDVATLDHTDRILMGMFGSHNRWGAFTLATGFGLGVDLNHQRACFVDGRPTDSGCDGLYIPVSATQAVDVSSEFYPVVLAVRLSLGVTID